MKAPLTEVPAVAALGVFATGAFAADRVNANGNTVVSDVAHVLRAGSKLA